MGVIHLQFSNWYVPLLHAVSQLDSTNVLTKYLVEQERKKKY
jgi:hypothetical protein